VARVLLGITGGIAAYKACELLRLLVKEAHEVVPILTPEAERFVTAHTVEALARRETPKELYPHLTDADLLVIAPSNPYVSVAPILAVAAIADALGERTAPCVAISPLIGGRAVKGPADRMLERVAGGTTPAHVAGCYAGLIDVLVVDEADEADLDGLGGVRPLVTRTLMRDETSRHALAEAALGAVATR
jgi:LPPG:FO 2-phospho-L-lactate transferase